MKTDLSMQLTTAGAVLGMDSGPTATDLFRTLTKQEACPSLSTLVRLYLNFLYTQTNIDTK